MKKDGHIMYSSTSIEEDETGRYCFWWHGSDRVAVERLSDFVREINVRINDN